MSSLFLETSSLASPKSYFVDLPHSPNQLPHIDFEQPFLVPSGLSLSLSPSSSSPETSAASSLHLFHRRSKLARNQSSELPHIDFEQPFLVAPELSLSLSPSSSSLETSAASSLYEFHRRSKLARNQLSEKSPPLFPLLSPVPLSPSADHFASDLPPLPPRSKPLAKIQSRESPPLHVYAFGSRLFAYTAFVRQIAPPSLMPHEL
jgi:hypothetical protein